MGKRKGRMPMPSYYGKNIAQHTQRRVLKRQREAREASHRAETILIADELDGKRINMIFADEVEREAEDGRR